MAEVKNICLEALERHCSSGETGRLDFRHGVHEGQIFTQDRLLVHAQLSGLEGIPSLFRLFDWGDAETTWHAGVQAEQPTLHLPLQVAIVLYAEHLRDRASLEAQEKERVEQELGALELIAGQAGGIESILKNYTVSIECDDRSYLPEGFKFSDTAKSSYVIGSSDECDVVLNHPSVDPLHCGVILENGSVYIWDLGSQSGTKLNGVTVAEDVLKVGDVMTLGALDFHVRFQLRRPTLKKPHVPTATSPMPPAATITSTGPVYIPGSPKKVIPRGAITFDKVSRQLKQSDKAKPLLTKLGSIFGIKNRK